MLQKEDFASIGFLSSELGVSETTIRRDLGKLQTKGLLSKTYGGATSNSRARFELSFASRETEKEAEKQAIGAAAASLIDDGDTIIIDSGTTTMQVARFIGRRADLMVATTALNVALELEGRAGITVILTGGTLRAKTHALVNPLALDVLKQINADKAFVGVGGVSVESGITSADFADAEVKRAIRAASQKLVVVADHSKFNRRAAALVFPLSGVDVLVTDDKAPPEELKRIREAGISVVVAPAELRPA
ncbi:MAG: DeoR/GlpR transcriptional regulator [Firmicutes bacterium]|nr:DeoR/GlpR transcriptional regulator [Bacillota bacterium]